MTRTRQDGGYVPGRHRRVSPQVQGQGSGPSGGLAPRLRVADGPV